MCVREDLPEVEQQSEIPGAGDAPPACNKDKNPIRRKKNNCVQKKKIWLKALATVLISYLERRYSTGTVP